MLGEGITLAYIDPGTGSFLLQSAIAGVIGAFFYFRNAIKRLFNRLFRRKETPPADGQGSPEA